MNGREHLVVFLAEFSKPARLEFCQDHPEILSSVVTFWLTQNYT